MEGGRGKRGAADEGKGEERERRKKKGSEGWENVRGKK